MADKNQYVNLYKFLINHKNQETIELSFQEIKEILGFELPDSAKNRQVWWNWSQESNTHPHARNWKAIGWDAKLKSTSVLFTNNDFISNSEIQKLDLSIPEIDFYINYPRLFVSRIDISVDDWVRLLREENGVFKSADIELLKRIYLSPNHATTCYSLSILEGISPSSYNIPVVNCAKRIVKILNLSQLYDKDGENTFMPYLFWGRIVDEHKHFEWLLRPELAIALRTVFPYLQNQTEDLFLDEQLNIEISKTLIPEKIEDEPLGPKNKVDTVFNNGHEGYPRSKNTAYAAFIKSNYSCENNPTHKSFINKTTGKKYLEAHHLVPLSHYKEFDNSLDHVANIVCLCSECHNRIHYGEDSDVLVKKLFLMRKESLEKAGIKIDLDDLIQMYK